MRAKIKPPRCLILKMKLRNKNVLHASLIPNILRQPHKSESYPGVTTGAGAIRGATATNLDTAK